MAVKEEQPLKVYYEKAVVGEFFVDLFVENEIIVELKSVENLSKAHACPVQFTSVTAQRI
jgi:GxxExxY protein